MPTRRHALLAAGAGLATATASAASAQMREASNSTRLAGKVALVTGAARGIGRAISETYAQAGAKVVLFDLADPSAVPAVEGFRIANSVEFAAAEASVKALSPESFAVRGDVRNPEDLVRAVSLAESRLGGLDIVVANAGYVRWHGFADGTPEDWNSVLDINVTGVANSIIAATPAFRRRGGGSAITLSSIGGRMGAGGNGAYTASKWAVIGLTKQAANELGGDNIRVNAIAPGPIDTPMYRSLGQIRSMGVDSAEAQDAMLNPILPLGDQPALPPEAIADTALFLASDDSAMMSGSVLDVALGFNANYTG
ncbi:MAG: SDR family oxidoreductase [Pseudomonadota bacterium]